MAFKTEYDFVLPLGYVDREGNVHRNGTMRLATAKDEIMPLQDPRVQSNRSYLIILLLARVITRLDGVRLMDTRIVEELFAEDLKFLQDFYQQINRTGSPYLEVTCPSCKTQFEIDLGGAAAGES